MGGCVWVWVGVGGCGRVCGRVCVCVCVCVWVCVGVYVCASVLKHYTCKGHV